MARDYNDYLALMPLLSITHIDQKIIYGESAPFRFQDLPAELRIRIYELVVDIKITKPSLEAQGDDYYARIRRRSVMDMQNPHPTLALRSRVVFIGNGPKLLGYNKPAKPTATFPLLAVSKSIQREAAPIYYEINTFVFYGCPLRRVLTWIFNNVGEDKKSLRRVRWQGDNVSFFNMGNLRDAIIILLLEQKRVLKEGAVSMSFQDYGHHPLCGIKKMMIEGNVLGDKTAEQVCRMTYSELAKAVQSTVDLWWRVCGVDKIHRGNGECQVCGCAPSEEEMERWAGELGDEDNDDLEDPSNETSEG